MKFSSHGNYVEADLQRYVVLEEVGDEEEEVLHCELVEGSFTMDATFFSTKRMSATISSSSSDCICVLRSFIRTSAYRTVLPEES